MQEVFQHDLGGDRVDAVGVLAAQRAAGALFDEPGRGGMRGEALVDEFNRDLEPLAERRAEAADKE